MIPLLVFVRGDIFKKNKKEFSTATTSKARNALLLGSERLKGWAEHNSPPLMHTGGKTPLVRSFAFSYKSDVQYDCVDCSTIDDRYDKKASINNTNETTKHIKPGLCKLHQLPIIYQRSTLKNNLDILKNEFSPLIRWMDQSLSYYMPNGVIDYMNVLKDRCANQWVLFNTVFTSLGVHINFSQHYHVDEVDAKNSVAAAIYHIDNPNNETGGELVFPQLQMYLKPKHGDQVFWRTNRIIHGVSP
jgi:hypothetical protein